MKLSSAKVMQEGKRIIRALNDPCDASCATWFACANSKPDGICKGFILMNGQTRKHLDKILNEDDAIYVQNAARMAQGECNEETRSALVQEVLRFIPHEPQRREGFLGMLEASHGLSNTPIRERIIKSRNAEYAHIVPNRPNFCKPKNPNGVDEE